MGPLVHIGRRPTGHVPAGTVGSVHPRVPSAAAIAILVSTSGCSGYLLGAGDVVTSTSGHPGRTGAQLDGVAALGIAPVVFTAGLHGMLAGRVSEIAPSVGVDALTPLAGYHVVPYGGLALRPIALGWADGAQGLGGRQLSFSVASPQLDAGVMFLFSPERFAYIGPVQGIDGCGIVVHAGGFYDVRVTSQADELYLSAGVGVACFTDTDILGGLTHHLPDNGQPGKP